MLQTGTTNCYIPDCSWNPCKDPTKDVLTSHLKSEYEATRASRGLQLRQREHDTTAGASIC